MTTDDTAAAVARLDADLAAAAANGELQALRRHAVGAYRSALAHAAGIPDDPRWRFLARTVATFAARVPAGFAQSSYTAAAVERLNALVAENLA
jgi:hypothetical protein